MAAPDTSEMNMEQKKEFYVELFTQCLEDGCLALDDVRTKHPGLLDEMKQGDSLTKRYIHYAFFLAKSNLNEQKSR